MWDNWVSKSLKDSLGKLWRLSSDNVGRLYCFLAGTHDVGKATVTFARMRPDCTYLISPMSAAGLPLEWPYGEEGAKFPHGMASALILREWLTDRGMKRPLRNAISEVLDAHHGFTSDSQKLKNATEIIEDYPDAWVAVHQELLDSMAALAGVDSALDELKEVPVADALQLMTGLLMMADWIASNERAFTYDPVTSQEERLVEGMRYINLPPAWSPTEVPEDINELFRQTFGWPERFETRPVQSAVVKVLGQVEGQCLLIIEAPTGEGKTEAGLAAAHVIGQRTGAQGIFFAAPTMSTANGLSGWI